MAILNKIFKWLTQTPFGLFSVMGIIFTIWLWPESFILPLYLLFGGTLFIFYGLFGRVVPPGYKAERRVEDGTYFLYPTTEETKRKEFERKERFHRKKMEKKGHPRKEAETKSLATSRYDFSNLPNGRFEEDPYDDLPGIVNAIEREDAERKKEVIGLNFSKMSTKTKEDQYPDDSQTMMEALDQLDEHDRTGKQKRDFNPFGTFEAAKNLLKFLHDNGQFGDKPMPTDAELRRLWEEAQEEKRKKGK